jgi:demethylmenaquinone methyltransferase/2-methoxy-6-polyprenyl-1,4-benzoquinol methylase
MVRAQLDKQSAQVSAMFDEVAHGYDRTRSLLWLGQMRRWGRATTASLALAPGRTVLDVACGTGTSSACLARSGAQVTGCDFSPGMLDVARTRAPEIEFVFGDALKLPFEDATFDAATISFGLRNVADTRGAIAEMRRVVKPGGRLAICEFSHPPSGFVRAISTAYLRHGVPFIARRVSSSPQAYDYLVESIAAWPDQATLADVIRDAGWGSVTWRNLSGGVVAVHSGVRGRSA